MLKLSDIRDWLASQNAIDGVWTIGRFEAEKEKRVCLYQRPSYEEATVAIGGRVPTKTLVKHLQIIVHWNRNYRETEEAAQALYDALKFNPRGAIGTCSISYLNLQLPEPADLGSDSNGIFERVLWMDVYYKEV